MNLEEIFYGLKSTLNIDKFYTVRSSNKLDHAADSFQILES